MVLKPLTSLLCRTGTNDVIVVKNLCKDNVYNSGASNKKEWRKCGKSSQNHDKCPDSKWSWHLLHDGSEHSNRTYANAAFECEICANNSGGGPHGHQELFEWSTQEADLLSNIITGDKSWVSASEPEMRYQSCECHTKMSCQKKKLQVSKFQDMLIAFLTVWMRWAYVWTTNSKFHFLCRSSEACDRLQKVEKAGKTDRHQWSMSHNPRNTALFNDEPNSNNPQPLHSPGITLCNFWLLLTSRLALKVVVLYPKKKFNRTWQQVSQPYQERNSSGASHNGTRAGTVYVQKRHTLTITNILFTTTYAQIPGTFWSSHVSHTARH